MGITNFLSGGNESRSIKAAQKGVKAFEQLSTPDIKAMELELEELVQQGVIKPEEAKLYLQEKSAASGISTDPRFDNAQMAALESLQEIGEGGMTDMDRAALAKITSEENTAARGAREAILSGAQARGVGGSGLELMAQLQNAQDSATRQSARDTEVAGQSQERALQALQGAGALGGQMQDRSFGQQLAKADRTDAIDRFNTSNRNEIGALNTGVRNQAQYSNLGEKQRVADSNVNTRNEEQKSNKSLAQLEYENSLKRAGGIAGAQQGVSQAYGQAAANTTNLVGSGIQAAGAVGGGFATKSDKNSKTGIKEIDASEFLNSLTPTKFHYKEPSLDGEGEHVGVIAQDVEKVAPEAIIDSPDGKRIDMGKMGNRILAALTSMNDRVNKLEGK